MAGMDVTPTGPVNSPARAAGRRLDAIVDPIIRDAQRFTDEALWGLHPPLAPVGPGALQEQRIGVVHASGLLRVCPVVQTGKCSGRAPGALLP